MLAVFFGNHFFKGGGWGVKDNISVKKKLKKEQKNIFNN